MTARITVSPAGGAAYDVVVGEDVTAELGRLLAGSHRVAVLHPEALDQRAGALVEQLVSQGYAVEEVRLPDGEQAKQLSVAEHCWNTLGDKGFTRSDAIVGLGGGAVTDLAGFVAATWLRGVPVVHIPTTLLAMVDAAVGGKTAINVAAGKNLVGSFHQPLGVLCDLSMLATVPTDDYVSGLAEVIKAGFIADPVILDLVETDPQGVRDPAHPATAELVSRSIAVKADVVSGDPTEQGRREILNYGHTLGHAIEKVEAFRWRHGAAVSVGLVFAAALGRLSGRLDAPTADRHRDVLAAVGLPTSYAGDWPALLDAMRVDKKARGTRTRFIVLDGLARPGTLDDPDPALLQAAYAEVSR